MIPKNPRSTVLRFIREHCEQFGEAPDVALIEVAADFRVRGGLLRCLDALREVALNHIAAVALIEMGRPISAPKPPAAETVVVPLDTAKLARKLAKALAVAHGMDDGDGVFLVGSEQEFRDTLHKVLG